jgi:hypothetical protein
MRELAHHISVEAQHHGQGRAWARADPTLAARRHDEKKKSGAKGAVESKRRSVQALVSQRQGARHPEMRCGSPNLAFSVP